MGQTSNLCVNLINLYINELHSTTNAHNMIINTTQVLKIHLYLCFIILIS